MSEHATAQPVAWFTPGFTGGKGSLRVHASTLVRPRWREDGSRQPRPANYLQAPRPTHIPSDTASQLATQRRGHIRARLRQHSTCHQRMCPAQTRLCLGTRQAACLRCCRRLRVRQVRSAVACFPPSGSPGIFRLRVCRAFMLVTLASGHAPASQTHVPHESKKGLFLWFSALCHFKSPFTVTESYHITKEAGTASCIFRVSVDTCRAAAAVAARASGNTALNGRWSHMRGAHRDSELVRHPPCREANFDVDQPPVETHVHCQGNEFVEVPVRPHKHPRVSFARLRGQSSAAGALPVPSLDESPHFVPCSLPSQTPRNSATAAQATTVGPAVTTASPTHLPLHD